MNIKKERIKLAFAQPNWLAIISKMRNDPLAKAILIGGPIHGNLGDHAIIEEEKSFLAEYFSGFSTYEITMPFYHVKKGKLKEVVKPEDILFISGGGWMGNLWIHNEQVIREVVSMYPNNEIVILPQTIYYTEDESGIKECKETSKIFSKHNNLHIFVRDKQSYQVVEENFELVGKSKVQYSPDMVLFGSIIKNNRLTKEKNPNTIILCMRDDCEAVGENNFISDVLQNRGYVVNKISTVKRHWVLPCFRKHELNKIFKKIAQSELVITDRLHCMLFSVLNGTPCIALNNRTGKVFGVYNWVKDEVVICANSLEDAINNIDKVRLTENKMYNPNKNKKYYYDMAKNIKRGMLENEN